MSNEPTILLAVTVLKSVKMTLVYFFFSSRRWHTRCLSDWSSDVCSSDLLNFLIDDPDTHTIVLFIEGIRRPQAFMHAAGRALAMGKPIIAIKTGATLESRAASQSHTGAIRSEEHRVGK